jgi:uncharacterized protein (DUF2249 family)
MTHACECDHASTVAHHETLRPVRADDTVADVAHRYAGALQTMKAMGINHCCGAHLTLSEAAAAAGVPVGALLAALTSSRPRALTDVAPDRQVHMDVRTDIRGGERPLARIISAVEALAGDQVLVLRAPLEPIPLYDVLGKRGFAHWTECHAADDWSVSFYRDATAPDSRTIVEGPATGSPGRVVLDVRGLEPPQPLVRVLAAIDRLDQDAVLEVRHDRRPVLLYHQLDDRGFAHETDEPEPGLVRIVIRTKSA